MGGREREEGRERGRLFKDKGYRQPERKEKGGLAEEKDKTRKEARNWAPAARPRRANLPTASLTQTDPGILQSRWGLVSAAAGRRL
jgi:hypothetical protein